MGITCVKKGGGDWNAEEVAPQKTPLSTIASHKIRRRMYLRFEYRGSVIGIPRIVIVIWEPGGKQALGTTERAALYGIILSYLQPSKFAT